MNQYQKQGNLFLNTVVNGLDQLVGMTNKNKPSDPGYQ